MLNENKLKDSEKYKKYCTHTAEAMQISKKNCAPPSIIKLDLIDINQRCT
jgi:hypothetical protein